MTKSRRQNSTKGLFFLCCNDHKMNTGYSAAGMENPGLTNSLESRWETWRWKNYYWGGAELRTSIVGIFNFQVGILDSRDSSCSLIVLAGSCSVEGKWCLFFLGPLFSFSINVIVFCPSLFFSSVIPFFLLSIMALPPAPQCIVFHFLLSPLPPPTHFFTILKSMHEKNFC